MKDWHRPPQACNIDKRIRIILAIKVTQSERERKIAASDLPVLCWGRARSWCMCSKWNTDALWWCHENWLQHKTSFSWDKGVNLPTWSKKVEAEPEHYYINIHLKYKLIFFSYSNVCPRSYVSQVPLLGKWNQTRNNIVNAVFLWKPFTLFLTL